MTPCLPLPGEDTMVVTSAPDIVMGPGAEVQIQSDAILATSNHFCRHFLHSDTFRTTFPRHPVHCQEAP